MLVYIAVDNGDGALRGGMFAKGSIVTERSPVAPLVPLTAVRHEKQGPVVYALVGNKVVAQPVTLGLRNEDEGYAEVKSGSHSVSLRSVIHFSRSGTRPERMSILAAGSVYGPDVS